MSSERDRIHLDVGEEGLRLTNGIVTVFFDTQLGLLMMTTADERTMCFSRVYFQAITDDAIFDSRKMIYRGISSMDFMDNGREGKAVVIRLMSADTRMEMHIRLTVLAGITGYSSVVQIKNCSGTEMRIKKIRPFILDVDDSSRLFTGWAADNLRFFKNGFHSWELTQSIPLPPDNSVSHLFSVIHNIQTHNTLALGFVTTAEQFSTVTVIGREMADNRLAQIIASCELDGVTLEDRHTLMSEELLVLATDRPIDVLEIYADTVARKMRAVSWHEIPTGWCSWYFYYTVPDEQEIQDNAEFVARRFPGVKWIQLDDGYQRTVGDWTVNDRFPSGLKVLVDRIRQTGLRAGVWVAPFVATEHSELYKTHPEWFVRGADGRPVSVGTNPLWLGQYFALDLTNPLVLDLVAKLFKELKQQGFEYFKIDFLYHATVEGIRHNMNVTRAQAFRNALEVIRRAVGDDLILGCGAPLGPCIGITDMMRIGTDIGTTWRYEWGGGVYECSINTMTRAFMHNRLWVNDPDCVLVRQNDSELTEEEVLLWLSVVALSGGAVLMSDRMRDVSEERLSLLDKILPPYGISAVALDALTESEPRLFALPIATPTERYTILGVFNLSEKEIDVTVDLADLRLPTGQYDVFEFWRQKYMGQVQNTLSVTALKPHSCRLFAVRPRSNHPSLLGTSMHFTQGAVDLKNVIWNAEQNELQVTVERDCRARESVVFVYGPDWRPTQCFIDNYTVQPELVTDGVIAVRGQFRRGQVIRLTFVIK